MFRLFTLHCRRALQARCPPRRIPRLVHHEAGRITPAPPRGQQMRFPTRRGREQNKGAGGFPPYPSRPGKYWVFLNRGADVEGRIRILMRRLRGVAEIGMMLKEWRSSLD